MVLEWVTCNPVFAHARGSANGPCDVLTQGFFAAAVVICRGDFISDDKVTSVVVARVFIHL